MLQIKWFLSFSSLALCFLLMPSAARADSVVLGQVDTFEGGTTQGWSAGSPHPVPPFVTTGGPGGASDHYLQVTSVGTPGPGGRLTVFNMSQWQGNYISAGVDLIVMDVNNLGTTDLSLRLLFENNNNTAVSTNVIFVPAGSGWTRINFMIGAGDLTALQGSVIGALTDVNELRLFHSPALGFPGPFISAQLGLDNITAAAGRTSVPEPFSLLLLGSGLAGVSAIQRRRKAC